MALQEMFAIGLNKNKLSKPTYSEPVEARKAQQDLNRQCNCKQSSDDLH